MGNQEMKSRERLKEAIYRRGRGRVMRRKAYQAITREKESGEATSRGYSLEVTT